MGRKAYTYIGERFGRLVVTSTYRENKRTYATVICDCGVKKDTRLDGLQSGATVSCGCYSKEQTSQLNKSHGMYKTKTYSSWDKMKARCNNPEYADYYSHITYDKSWELFENFYKDMGDRPEGTSLDRVDNSKGYCKDNCLWRSSSYQSKNQRKRLVDLSSSKYKGVGLDRRYLECFFFSVTKDYKTLRLHTNKDEILAAKYFNFCTKFLYGDTVTLNPVNDLEITVSEAERLQSKLDEIFFT